MALTHTTALARKIKSHDEWAEWVANLENGDLVLLQEFVPRSNDLFGDKAECWKFSIAKFYNNVIIVDYQDYPVKDGYVVYWNSDKHWGEVFSARIVPYHSDVAPLDGQTYRYCHAPVWEPEWYDQCRCTILVENIHRTLTLVHDEQLSFRRYVIRVREGDLLIIFGDDEQVRQWADSKGYAQFLYSEYLGL